MSARSATRATAGAAVLGMALSGALLWQSLRGGAVAGCGGGSCGDVISSRWGYLLGVPVSAFGVALYALVLASFMPRGAGFRRPLLAALPGAALWFVFVQAVFLKSFCPLCNGLHAIGLLTCGLGLAALRPLEIRRAISWAGAAFLTVGLLQVYGPVRQTHLMEGGIGAETVAGGSLSPDDGNPVFDPAEHPRLGPADAGRVLVEYFDYQCAACRTMAGHIDALLAAHEGKVAVLLMPVPLDGACNPELGEAPDHPGSCEIAGIALALWRKRPDAFADFHKALMASPSSETARRLALGLMSGTELETAIADPWISSSIRDNISAWKRMSRSSGRLPKLLIRDSRILHGLPSDTADFLRVMNAELGL